MTPTRRRPHPRFRAVRVAILLPVVLAAAAGAAPAQSRSEDPSDGFFRRGMIPRLRIEIGPEAVEALRAAPRSFVSVRLVEDGKSAYDDVQVKLKGAAGSFRPFDDRPAFTVRMSRTRRDQRFHGLAKFHLNNSVQDPSFLHELLAHDLFVAAGLHATRVTHAVVTINDRDPALYVLKEGFDEEFLRRRFQDASGSLYDGGFCQDIDAPLERDEGETSASGQDLRDLLAACREPDPALRWPRIEERLDVRTFLGFVAMELMIGHWDGYAMNRNNYRLYFDPAGGRAVFLPHGTDQIFGDPGWSILQAQNGIVADAVMKNPAWRKLYRRRVAELLPVVTAVEKIGRRIDEVSRRLKPALARIDPRLVHDHEREVRALKDRIAARAKSLRAQNEEPEPKPLSLAPGASLRLEDWRQASECEDAVLLKANLPGEKVLLIRAGPSGRCVASWRRNVLLGKGRWRFQAQAGVRDVELLSGLDFAGAGARVAGGAFAEALSGSAPRRGIRVEIEVAEEAQNVELVLELRARRGEVVFPLDSLRLTRLP